ERPGGAEITALVFYPGQGQESRLSPMPLIPVRLVSILVLMGLVPGRLPIGRNIPLAVRVVEVFRRLREQEDVLVSLRGAVPDRLGHGVAFHPKAVAPEIPPVILEREG